MEERQTSSSLEVGRGRWLLLAASFVIVVAGLRAAAPFLLPVLLAVFLALLSFPLVAWLIAKGVRMGLAVLSTVFVEVGAILVAGFLVSRAFNDFAKAAPGFIEKLVVKTRAGLEALQDRGLDLTEFFTLDRFEPGAVVDFAGGVLGGTVRGVASLVSYAVLVLLILVCLLYESVGIRAKLSQALGRYAETPRYLSDVTREIQRYLGIKTLVSATTGILLGLWVWALGVPFPLVWGLLAFVLNYIPAIGSILAAVPAVLVAVIQFGWGRALIVALGYLAVNFLLGNVLEPMWMGRRFGLSTLVVFLSLIFWGWVWGPVGMLLSVPLTMAIKIVLEESPGMRRLAVLLGPGPASAPAGD